ncbi:hypothetical protein M3Y94_00594700 [Aphelenchoides besseyi]|nr:hypothetical protein M3Y94_00594700 [Aphelenchoides besseyi]KAI6222162.1 hypothetical protein M3Y95_00955400 [Aphelenchoides besseyi]
MFARRSNLALFSGQFALSLMNVLFMFYYVKVFLQVFQVNEKWFNIAQVLFMFWNAINDPIFGYIQDVGGAKWMRNRSKIFTYIGPLMSISFLILWFPWRGNSSSAPYVEGLHLIFGLFVYDAFFSCIGVAWGALYTESTLEHGRRVNALKYSQLAILLSVNIIMITEKASHSLDDFKSFQYVCVVVAIVTLVCFLVSGRLGASLQRGREPLLEERERASEEEHGWRVMLKLTKELLRAKDFQRIMCTNFIHTCRTVSHLNFASIATDLLIPQRLLPKGSWQISLFFAACTLAPQLLVITNERLLVRQGAYRVMMFAFMFSIMSSGLYVLSWSPLVVLFFMFVDSILVHSISPLFNILLAEFVEDDLNRNARSKRMSSLIFSLNALLIKPATSIAPIVIVFFLNRNGYELYQKDKLRSETLSRCMARIIFLIPALLASLQYVVFRRYSIRNKNRVPVMPV